MLSLDIKKLYEMNEDEIISFLFSGALSGEYTTLVDAFGVDGVHALVCHPGYERFSKHMKDLIWVSVQALDSGDKLPTVGRSV